MVECEGGRDKKQVAWTGLSFLTCFASLSSVHKFYSVLIHLQTSGSLARVETSNALVNIHILDMFTIQVHIKPTIHTQQTDASTVRLPSCIRNLHMIVVLQVYLKLF